MPKLTADDLKFLVDNKVAMRWQLPEIHEKFKTNGGIEGDAYSLGDPKQWMPPTQDKADYFEAALRQKIEKVVGMHLGSNLRLPSMQGAHILLLKDVEGAHQVVTDKGGGYTAPFFTVGAFTRFTPGQMIGEIPVTPQMTNGFGYNGITTGDARQDQKVLNDIYDHVTGKVIEQIQRARGVEPKVALEAKASEKPNHEWERMRSSQHGEVLRISTMGMDQAERAGFLDQLRSTCNVNATIVRSRTFNQEYFQISGADVARFEAYTNAQPRPAQASIQTPHSSRTSRSLTPQI